MTISRALRLAPLFVAPAIVALGIAALAAAPAPAPEPRPAPIAAVAPSHAFDDFPAFVVATSPAAGAEDVDPATKEIAVTYSQDMMNGSWSWVTYKQNSYPKMTGKPAYDADKRTCRVAVSLEPGKTYAVSLNTPKFGNFKDASGKPAVPYLLVFRTKAP